ncbi:type II toxin-antitoxin system VapC family toxin [Pseudofrankia sp. DC12]|uniref:type II toxin-antitoxin system VapC family toxin n=1 Tax=Pseudofrankia sp. DC12 TaxID=683315 RepID=UPI0005F84C59|nr:type II toxin-antitoxin system VapC family toxin [Pseudofrankia sp. DC12]
MTTTLVDSNVLLDIATDDPTWSVWSAKALAGAAADGQLMINPLIYAELSVGFPMIEDLDDALPPDLYLRAPLPYEAAFLAGKAFVTYRRRGGENSSPLPDFYIGAHAAISGCRLLTRDAKRYRTYFPSVEIVAP